MGAAVTIELQKPVDASDIIASKSLKVAREEVIRLRTSLGHLAVENGFSPPDLEANDLISGENDEEDFDRCLQEISHIRRALALSTQTYKRASRGYIFQNSISNIPISNRDNNDNDDDDDEDSSDRIISNKKSLK